MDKFEYERKGDDPGLVLIFNQENFKNLSTRTGSTRDVNEIIISMQRQGFNIHEDDIMTNGTTQAIKDKLDKGILIIFLNSFPCLDSIFNYVDA